MAVKDINAAGGVLGRPLKIIYSDTKSEIPQGAVAAMEVIDQGADLLIVTGDFDFGGTAAHTANAQGKLAIAPFAADPKFGVEGIGPTPSPSPPLATRWVPSSPSSPPPRAGRRPMP